MSDGSTARETALERLSARRERFAQIRERAKHLADGGATGIQVAASISEATDAFVVDLCLDAVNALDDSVRQTTEDNAALIAVGGSGRGDLAPYSDVDLLFLHHGPANKPFRACAAQVVRDCWDAGIKLGQSVRTVGESIGLARQEIEVATTLVESRLLWGSERLFDELRQNVRRRVVGGRGRRKAFVNACLSARKEERVQQGATFSRLEPDVKRSLGGLRDIHLIRWVGFACYGVSDIDSLRLQGAISRDDARALLTAQEFLLRLRNDLHFNAGREHDMLTREEQLRLAEERNIEGSRALRPVERFMRTYFRHTESIADISKRFVARHQTTPVHERVVESLMTHRSDGQFLVGPRRIDVVARHRQSVLGSLDGVLKLFRSAAFYGVESAATAVDAIKRAPHEVPREVTKEQARAFLDILRCTGSLGVTLRGMYDVGLLERLIPDMAHARCLLQFNQYHSYTVDEHSLRAVEAAAAFENDVGPVGTAYRAIHHKEILHLALLLHDLGKGFEGDHSDIGAEIAERIAERLHLPDHHRDTVIFLVYRHLQMFHLALRRDISDPEVLWSLSREVGTPETLRMLYVLTAADLVAVGPGVWTAWKAEVLTELYDRTMLVVSGKHHRHAEPQRIAAVRKHVQNSIVPLESQTGDGDPSDWIRQRLDSFPPHYLAATPPGRIASDLDIMQRLEPNEIVVEGRFDKATRTVEFRVITKGDAAVGCFHKIAGALAAKRLEIVSADISTSSDGTVVDGFRVIDDDYEENVPSDRIDDVADTIRGVLNGEVSIKGLFKRHQRFGMADASGPSSDLPTRVVIDNDSSEHSTIVDVFAHDRRGLLYAISRELFAMGLSVVLAKIATHLDQVVDVFYVTDERGEKIRDGERLRTIRHRLVEHIESF
jgi:[protein-PII] uridylyltransferase